MGSCIRQKWDFVNDCPDFRGNSTAAEDAAFMRAISTPIPEYRAKLVRLPHGQTEISVTPANTTSVINARMGFNPLLDCPRKVRDTVEQELRDIENRGRAAKRARQKVRYLTKSLAADTMLTFTYRENVEDKVKVAADWKEFVRLYRQRFPDWAYLAVTEKQERGAYHIHVAVQGKQNIKWLLRCWLLALGQDAQAVLNWHVYGIKLGAASLGAVNIQPPLRGAGKSAQKWRRGNLAGYLTKYIGKEFEDSDKHAKKYWHSRNLLQPVIERFWLKATDYVQAIKEAHDLIYWTGANTISMWNDHGAGVVWITGETSRDLIGKTTQGDCDVDFL